MTAAVSHRFQRIERDLKNPVFTVKMPHSLKGRDLTGLGSTVGDDMYGTIQPLIDDIKNRRNCSMMVMPNVEHARRTFNGPQTDSYLTRNMGARWSPFDDDDDEGLFGTVDSTLAERSQSQTNMIICAIGWHLRPEPLCFTLGGMAVTRPGAQGPQPPASHTFTTIDAGTNDAGGTGPFAGLGAVPASYSHGWWANYACWLMIRAYNLRWMMGQNTNILNDSLARTAFMPTSAQEGSASNSIVDAAYFVQQLNAYYQQVSPGAKEFLKPNVIRVGSVGPTASNVGAFTPDLDGEFAQATYGGMGIRELLRGNSEFRSLSTPFAMGAGIPFGLAADVQNEDLAQAMRAWLSIAFTGQGIPALVSDDPSIYTAAATSPGIAERTLDGTLALQTLPTQKALYKGGRLIIETILKGFELDEDVWTAMKNNPRLREMICSECGVNWCNGGRG